MEIMPKTHKEDLILRNTLIVLGFLAIGTFTLVCVVVVALMTTNFNPLGWME